MARTKAKRRGKRAAGPVGAERIMTVLRDTPGAKTSDLEERLGAPQLQIRSELMDLEKAGKVYRTGQTRGTRWYIGDRPDGVDEPLPPEAGSDEARRGPKERVLDDNRALLGTMPDSDVAERTGVSVRTIAAYRKKHDIAGYSGPRKRAESREPARKAAEPAPTPQAAPAAPATPPAPAARAAAAPPKAAAKAQANGRDGGAAWRVDIRVRGENVVRYVFAPSLVDAARTASSGADRMGGEVVGIGWVGDALA